MKKLNKIPTKLTIYDETGVLGDSETITEKDLAQIDKQLDIYDLQIEWFENGAAINWTIQVK